MAALLSWPVWNRLAGTQPAPLSQAPVVGSTIRAFWRRETETSFRYSSEKIEVPYW